MLPCVPYRNYLILDVPGCATWEWIRGLSNNKDKYLLMQDMSEGSLDESHDEKNDKGMHHDQLQYPQPDDQHEEYMKMLQFHRTIGSSLSVIMDVICQHYHRLEGMTQSDSEAGSNVDNSE